MSVGIEYTKDQWDDLISKSEDELLLELGGKVGGNTQGMVSDSDPRKRAQLWIFYNRDKICTSDRVQKAVKSPDKYLVLAAIADAVGGGGAATAAVLVFKLGVERMCKENWTELK